MKDEMARELTQKIMDLLNCDEKDCVVCYDKVYALCLSLSNRQLENALMSKEDLELIKLTKKEFRC